MSAIKKSEPSLVSVFSDAIAAVLLLFFLHTMLYTWKQLISFKNMLAFYTTDTTQIAWMVIIIEFVIAIVLFIQKTRAIGFVLAATFGIMAIVIIRKTPGVPHDFGGIINHISVIMRYVVYGLVIVLGCSGLILCIIRRATVRTADPVPVAFT